jgi:hypothetical protein
MTDMPAQEQTFVVSLIRDGESEPYEVDIIAGVKDQADAIRVAHEWADSHIHRIAGPTTLHLRLGAVATILRRWENQ